MITTPTCPKCGNNPSLSEDQYCGTCELQYQAECRAEGLHLIKELQAYVDRQPDDADWLSGTLDELRELKQRWGVV